METDLLVLLILLALSAFFSGAETAMISLSHARVEALLHEGRGGAQALSRLKGNTNRMLIALLIGNNLVNIAASSLTTVLASRQFGNMGTGIAVGGLTLLILLFGEITPKTFATRHAVVIALHAAPFLLFFSHLVYPLTLVLERFTTWMQNLSPATSDPVVTESELISMARHGAEEGSIEQDEHQMIQRIFAFDDLRAENIMVPRHLIFSMEASLTIRQALPQLLAHPHSRVPLHTGKPDAIIRVVFLRDILAEIANGNWEKTLDQTGHDPLFVPLNYPLNDLFDLLRSRKKGTVIVVDAFGQLQGLVTLEDILEELVGEIYDEMDPPPASLNEIEPGILLVEGTVELRPVEEFFGQSLSSGKPSDTVSMWILHHAQRIPAATETFLIDGLSVTIVRATRRRIMQVRIARDEPFDPP
ncbi:MAG: HlyC/CorC family transporter [Magnetococcales bacterium]|nr:HlyC/CorC family transporter [Magnetococcales bacterium]